MADSLKELRVKIILRHADEVTWYNENPLLLEGEAAVTTSQTAALIKIGDGSHRWRDLQYLRFEEVDPTVAQYIKDITQSNIYSWNNKVNESDFITRSQIENLFK